MAAPAPAAAPQARVIRLAEAALLRGAAHADRIMLHEEAMSGLPPASPSASATLRLLCLLLAKSRLRLHQALERSEAEREQAEATLAQAQDRLASAHRQIGRLESRLGLSPNSGAER